MVAKSAWSLHHKITLRTIFFDNNLLVIKNNSDLEYECINALILFYTEAVYFVRRTYIIFVLNIK